jgi:hypothetical protein
LVIGNARRGDGAYRDATVALDCGRRPVASTSVRRRQLRARLCFESAQVRCTIRLSSPRQEESGMATKKKAAKKKAAKKAAKPKAAKKAKPAKKAAPKKAAKAKGKAAKMPKGRAPKVKAAKKKAAQAAAPKAKAAKAQPKAAPKTAPKAKAAPKPKAAPKAKAAPRSPVNGKGEAPEKKTSVGEPAPVATRATAPLFTDESSPEDLLAEDTGLDEGPEFGTEPELDDDDDDDTSLDDESSDEDSLENEDW